MSDTVPSTDEPDAVMENAVDPEAFQLDVKNKQPGMWLVKIPSGDLAAAIDFAVDNEQLGELWKFAPTSLHSKRKASAAFDLKIDDNFRERFDDRPSRPGAVVGKRGKLLQNFTVDSKERPPVVSVFAESKLPGTSNTTTSVELQGVINTEVQINADVRNNYAEIAKGFEHKLVVAQQQTEAKEIDSTQIGHLKINETIKNARKQQVLKDEKKKENAMHSHGVTDEQIKQRLFKLFQEFEYWTFADLITKTKFPAQRVRDTLRTIAQNEQGGDHKGKYRLKAVYTTHH
eukprot:m.77239 g.77239  ORF g.77239 m.77239 type:complete len:288 (-) comp24993_c0_seq1:27-890(-)